jgi:hypothetical protein
MTVGRKRDAVNEGSVSGQSAERLKGLRIPEADLAILIRDGDQKLTVAAKRQAAYFTSVPTAHLAQDGHDVLGLADEPFVSRDIFGPQLIERRSGRFRPGTWPWGATGLGAW